MKSVILSLIVVLTTVFAQAAGRETAVSLPELGVSLQKTGEPYKALVKFAKTQSAKSVVVSGSVEVIRISTKSGSFGDADSIYVRFELLDKSAGEEEGSLFCEGTIDLKNYVWSFDGGCEP